MVRIANHVTYPFPMVRIANHVICLSDTLRQAKPCRLQIFFRPQAATAEARAGSLKVSTLSTV